MAEDKEVVEQLGLSDVEKDRLTKLAQKEAKERIRKEAEKEFLEAAKKEAYEALRPKSPAEELWSIFIEVPDSTGLLIDGKLFQHNIEYLVPHSQWNDIKDMMAKAWKLERELNNPFSGSKWYKQPFQNPTVLRGSGQSPHAIPSGFSNRY